MSRPPNIIPSVKLTTRIPLDVMNQLNAYLYSELEGGIPRGAYQKFFVERIKEFFSSRDQRSTLNDPKLMESD